MYQGKHPQQAPLRQSLSTVTCGLLLGTVLIGYLIAGAARAGSETSLAAHDITLNGTVTAPSCTVTLENSHMIFSRSTGAPVIQTLQLNLSQCEADGIGVMFKADHWPDNPVRGTLLEKLSHARNRHWYYTIGPADEETETPWPLQLAIDSPLIESDKQQSGNDHGRYFSLAQVNYWYDLKQPLQDNQVLAIPFNVQLHPALVREGDENQGELESTFMLQISWR
ncbi:hypothetical protein [Serratia fonticola]|uniref:hypothetical protein n=1 Tax=Serratia fonticola TaxID=47917 RepID=UPI002DC0640A|nr:hypothetical protein [Serratia fonticola]MEB7884010.1 hypothetical protein [Serratia fonticola]